MPPDDAAGVERVQLAVMTGDQLHGDLHGPFVWTKLGYRRWARRVSTLLGTD
jgi:hypothetical protein